MSSKVETLTNKPNIMITYYLTVFTLTPNTWLWLTLNPDFVLNCVLRQHVWSALKRGRFRSLASLILVVNVVGELQRKRTLATLRGFLAAARLSCCRIHPCDRQTDRQTDGRTSDGIYALKHMLSRVNKITQNTKTPIKSNPQNYESKCALADL